MELQTNYKLKAPDYWAIKIDGLGNTQFLHIMKCLENIGIKMKENDNGRIGIPAGIQNMWLYCGKDFSIYGFEKYASYGYERLDYEKFIQLFK